jgi:type IV secretory pathway VirB10-like protein
MQYMLRRVLKRKEADRALWVTLFVLTVLGVAIAMLLTANAEKKRTGRTDDLTPSEFVENPAASHRADSSASPAPRASVAESTLHSEPAQPAAVPPPAPAAAPAPRASHTAATAPQVVALLTTPSNPTVAAMTPACRSAMQSRGTWQDPQAERPWPECVDAAGNPMVVQFCTYARLASGEWVLSENNRRAPRCQAEFPLVRDGKLKGLASR